MKILVVEDEELLAKGIAKGLRKSGYAVDCAYDGEEALEMWELNSYDLMILDLNLPKKDGMEVLAEIRRKDKEFRVLILSARNSLEDKIKGLDAGSNDYLTKPFEFAELEARIRSLLRREFRQKDVLFKCSELELDSAAKAVFFKRQEINLTKKEYALLEYLMIHKGRTISAEEFMEHVWDSDVDLFSNTFKYHIHSLKKKLEAAGVEGYITTLRGQGYRMSEPEGEKNGRI